MEVVLPIGSELSEDTHLTKTEEKGNDFFEDNFLEVSGLTKVIEWGHSGGGIYGANGGLYFACIWI